MYKSVYLFCICSAIEHGVNYFDTAEIYGEGIAELAMGKAFKKLNIPRKDFVLSTKYYKCGSGVNDKMLSRKHLIEGIDASLKRLQLDYVDVVFAHRYDTFTPIEEICRAFNWIIEHGKAFYWGTSQWTPEEAMEANLCCERLGLIKPIVEQAEYSLIRRQFMEANLIPMFDKLGYGTTVYSPLANGMLSGKYNDGKPPEGSRLVSDKLTKSNIENIMKRYTDVLGDQLYPKLKALGELSKEIGCSQAQLSLAWCIANKDVSVCLMGASKPEQVIENIGCLQVVKKWSKDIEEKVEKIMGNRPDPAFNWRDWKPFEHRRNTSVEFRA